MKVGVGVGVGVRVRVGVRFRVRVRARARARVRVGGEYRTSWLSSVRSIRRKTSMKRSTLMPSTGQTW